MIKFNNISKTYSKQTVLDVESLEIQPGQAFGRMLRAFGPVSKIKARGVCNAVQHYPATYLSGAKKSSTYRNAAMRRKRLARKQMAAPKRSHAWTLATAPNMHALCVLMTTCTRSMRTRKN